MLFEWDEAKSRHTLEERGFGFEYAARIFLGPTLERPDDRDDTRHIISARLASRKERRLWQSFAEQWKTSAE